MATTRIIKHHISKGETVAASLADRFDYGQNHDKTDGGELIRAYCRLCRALNSLPDIQGRRIEAHYLLGQSQAAIAKAEGVTKGAVSVSITRGLAAMKKFLQKP